MQLRLWMRVNRIIYVKFMNQERRNTRENEQQRKEDISQLFYMHYYHNKTKDGQLHENK